jgi:hypothetical protein
MVDRRSGQGNRISSAVANRRGRGLLSVKVVLPRYVIAKSAANGPQAFYYNVPMRLRRRGCPIRNEALGTSYVVACGEDGNGGRAAVLNGLVDEWDANRKGLPVSSNATPKIGTVDWLFREYKQSKAYLEKVSPRSRINYEWAMRAFCDLPDKSGQRTGSKAIKSISPRAADKIYDKLVAGPKGERLRTAEKLTMLARKAWKVVHRLFPVEFNNDVPNPWVGVTMKTRIKGIKAAVTREQVYVFAHGCIEAGEIEVAAAAVICFEWLQRPENVIAGHIKWSDYRSPQAPNIIRVQHHKTGAIVLHPLEERLDDGTVVKFYEDAEAVLSHLHKRGTPMILREVDEDKFKPFSFSGMQKIVQRMRKELGLPPSFTLDACRHGGMTELEEAELTDGQGRALSAHRTQQSYEGYAKRNLGRALSATRKRYAHVLANAPETSVQKTPVTSVQNEKFDNSRSA